MNEMMAALETRGLVSRTEDPNNRRVLLISLTKEGENTLASADRRVDFLEEQFFRSLSSSEHKILRKLLNKVIEDVRLVNA